MSIITGTFADGPESGSIELFPSDNSQVLNEGASISLKCSADCSPACSYTWYLGNDAVNSTGGVLSLVAVGPEDAGTYRCTAQNSIGLASSDIVTVVVQSQFPSFVMFACLMVVSSP